MTVAELIDELQQCHPEWHVTIDGLEVAAVHECINVTGEKLVELRLEAKEND